MQIEILNYGSKGCKAKCPTCPHVVSGPNSGPYYDLMFEATSKLKNKFKKDEVVFSLQSDISELLVDLKRFSFGIEEIGCGLGCNIKLPFDTKVVKENFRYLEEKAPNAKLFLFLENRGFLSDYTTDIINLIKIFFFSKIKDLTISCHNNSMRTNIFDQRIEEMFQANIAMFKQIASIYPTDSFEKSFDENSIPFLPKNYKQFISSLNLKLPSKRLGIKERVLSFEDNTDRPEDLISIYKDFFVGELKGETFDKENINLAFTYIGVRVNHRSIDIKNPYLWFSYDEFFQILELSQSLEEVCFRLVSSMKKTLQLDLKISEINHETVSALANARRELR